MLSSAQGFVFYTFPVTPKRESYSTHRADARVFLLLTKFNNVFVETVYGAEHLRFAVINFAI